MQEALFSNKITILSLKAKISELEFKLARSIPRPYFSDLDSDTLTEITDEQEDSKLPDWVNNNLRNLIHGPNLINKVWEIDKSFKED